MKKLIFLLISIIAMLFAAEVPAAADSEISSFEKLKKYMDDAEPWQISISVLNTSVSFKSSFIMEKDDFLVIPRGKTLRLKNGAELDGNIYIENGGKLIFESGRVFVRGTIVSDGTIIVYTGGENAYIGGAAVFVSGTLYVSEQGKLTEKKSDGTGIEIEFTDRISRGDYGSIICLGKTNCKYGDIAKKPIAAVVSQRAAYTSDFVESKVITESIEELYPDAGKYFRDEDITIGGGGHQYFSILFDNGVCLYINLQISDGEMKCCSICGLDVHLAMEALDMVREA